MSASRPDLRNSAPPEPREASSRRADDPAVDRADARRPAHHSKGSQNGAPALDHGDVRARSATLDDDPLADPELVERGGHPGRWPGADGERGLAPKGVDTHCAAVAAQYEERHIEPRPRECACHERGRTLDDRQDAGVDRGADGARLETVGAGQLVPGAGGKPARERPLGDEPLVGRSVDCESAADGYSGAARLREPLERRVDFGLREPMRRVEEFVLGRERAARSELDLADLGPFARRPEIGCCSDTDHPDTRDVALEERVHRLGRREADERDAAPCGAEFREQLPER